MKNNLTNKEKDSMA